MAGERRSSKTHPVRLKHWYWVSEEPLAPELCDRIVAEGERLDLFEATIRKDTTGGKIRRSEIGWFSRKVHNDWLLDPLWALVQQANAACWNWAVDQLQSVQYTTYGEGEFYAWHTDQEAKPYVKEPGAGKVRKLSVSVQLSEADDYEGGDFELEEMYRIPSKHEMRIRVIDELRPRGSVLVFPAHLFHQVTPVTCGVRRSLVAWYLGPPFV